MKAIAILLIAFALSASAKSEDASDEEVASTAGICTAVWRIQSQLSTTKGDKVQAALKELDAKRLARWSIKVKLPFEDYIDGHDGVIEYFTKKEVKGRFNEDALKELATFDKKCKKLFDPVVAGPTT